MFTHWSSRSVLSVALHVFITLLYPSESFQRRRVRAPDEFSFRYRPRWYGHWLRLVQYPLSRRRHRDYIDLLSHSTRRAFGQFSKHTYRGEIVAHSKFIIQCDQQCTKSSLLELIPNCENTACACQNSTVQQFGKCLQCAADTYTDNTPSLNQNFIDGKRYFAVIYPNRQSSTPITYSIDITLDCETNHITVSDFTLTTPAIKPTRTPTFHTSTAGDSFDDGSSRLSPGAIIAIVICVPLGTALLLSLVGWIFAARSRNRRREMLKAYWEIKQ